MRAIFIPLLAFALISTVLLAPVGVSKHPTDLNVVNLYFDDPKPSFIQPISATPKIRYLCDASASAPPTFCRGPSENPNVQIFGGLKNPFGRKTTPTTDLSATLWLSVPGYTAPVAPNPAGGVPVSGLKVQVKSGDIVVATLEPVNVVAGASNPLNPMARNADGAILLLNNAPQAFVVAGKSIASFSANGLIELRLTVNTIGTPMNVASGNANVGNVTPPASPLNVAFHYGSTAHPSRLGFGIDGAAEDLRVGNGALRLGVLDGKLQSDLVDSGNGGAASLGCTSSTVVTCGGGYYASAGLASSNFVLADFPLGNVTAADTYNLLSDGVFTGWVRLEGDAKPQAGVLWILQAQLWINGKRTSWGSTQFAINVQNNTDQGPQVPLQVSIGLNTTGVSIKKGDDLGITLGLASISEDPAAGAVLNNMTLLYGSDVYPTGIVAGADTTYRYIPPAGPTTTARPRTTTPAGDGGDDTTTPGAKDPIEPASAKEKNVSVPGNIPGFELVALLAAGLIGAAALRRRRA